MTRPTACRSRCRRRFKEVGRRLVKNNAAGSSHGTATCVHTIQTFRQRLRVSSYPAGNETPLRYACYEQHCENMPHGHNGHLSPIPSRLLNCRLNLGAGEQKPDKIMTSISSLNEAASWPEQHSIHCSRRLTPNSMA